MNPAWTTAWIDSTHRPARRPQQPRHVQASTGAHPASCSPNSQRWSNSVAIVATPNRRCATWPGAGMGGAGPVAQGRRRPAERPGGLVNADSVQPPRTGWVTDPTCARTGSGLVYVAFVTDAFNPPHRGPAGLSTVSAPTSRCAPTSSPHMGNEPAPGTTVAGLVHHADRGDESGFNWWSQHLDLEVSYGRAGGVGDRVDGVCADEVAGQAVVVARSGAGALARGRDGRDGRGGRACGRGFPGGRCALVPRGWRDANYRSCSSFWPVPVFR